MKRRFSPLVGVFSTPLLLLSIVVIFSKPYDFSGDLNLGPVNMNQHGTTTKCDKTAAKPEVTRAAMKSSLSTKPQFNLRHMKKTSLILKGLTFVIGLVGIAYFLVKCIRSIKPHLTKSAARRLMQDGNNPCNPTTNPSDGIKDDDYFETYQYAPENLQPVGGSAETLQSEQGQHAERPTGGRLPNQQPPQDENGAVGGAQYGQGPYAAGPAFGMPPQRQGYHVPPYPYGTPSQPYGYPVPPYPYPIPSQPYGYPVPPYPYGPGYAAGPSNAAPQQAQPSHLERTAAAPQQQAPQPERPVAAPQQQAPNVESPVPFFTDPEEFATAESLPQIPKRESYDESVSELKRLTFQVFTVGWDTMKMPVAYVRDNLTQRIRDWPYRVQEKVKRLANDITDYGEVVSDYQLNEDFQKKMKFAKESIYPFVSKANPVVLEFSTKTMHRVLTHISKVIGPQLADLAEKEADAQMKQFLNYAAVSMGPKVLEMAGEVVKFDGLKHHYYDNGKFLELMNHIRHINPNKRPKILESVISIHSLMIPRLQRVNNTIALSYSSVVTGLGTLCVPDFANGDVPGMNDP